MSKGGAEKEATAWEVTLQTQPGVWRAVDGTNVIPMPFTILHSKRKTRVDVSMSAEKDSITIDYAQCVCPRSLSPLHLHLHHTAPACLPTLQPYPVMWCGEHSGLLARLLHLADALGRHAPHTRREGFEHCVERDVLLLLRAKRLQGFYPPEPAFTAVAAPTRSSSRRL